MTTSRNNLVPAYGAGTVKVLYEHGTGTRMIKYLGPKASDSITLQTNRDPIGDQTRNSKVNVVGATFLSGLTRKKLITGGICNGGSTGGSPEGHPVSRLIAATDIPKIRFILLLTNEFQNRCKYFRDIPSGRMEYHPDGYPGK